MVRSGFKISSNSINFFLLKDFLNFSLIYIGQSHHPLGLEGVLELDQTLDLVN